jgi:hypothetical protein
VLEPSSGGKMSKDIKIHKKVHALWEAWFAWRPVRVHDSWAWLKTVYRYKTNNYVDHDDWPQYSYGTIFDVVKDE